MPGLTQQDVTPVVPQVEGGAKEEKEEGYQWMRWITKPGNELQHLGNQVTDFVKRRNANVQSTGNVGILRIYTEKDQPGVIKTGALPVEREGTQGVVEATANVGLAGVNLGQNIVEQVVAPIQGREPEAQDPEETLLGRPLAGLKEASANLLGVPQRYELPESDRLLRDVSGEVAVATALGLLIGKTPLNPLGNSTSFTGTRLNPFTSPGLRELVNTRGPLAAAFRNQNVARLRPLLRWGSAIGIESMLTTAVTDNRETAWAEPGDDQTRAALKALIPQAGLDVAVVGSIFGVGKGVQKLLELPGVFQSIARNNKSHNTVNDVGQARTWAEENGLQQRNGEGSYEFIADDPWSTGPVSDAEVSTAFDQPSRGAEPPRNPREAINQMVGSGDRDIPDIWDASLPEVDVAIRGLDQMDDEGLTAIANRPPEQPIAEALGEQLNRQQQMRQAQEQLREVAQRRLLQRQSDAAVKSDAADQLQDLKATQETQAIAEAEGVNGVPTEQINEMLIPDQEMFEAIDVPQLQQIAALDANVGAELAKAGTSPVKATRRELIDAILRVRQKNAGAASPIQAPPSAMPAAQRNAVKKQVIRQAINEGQVRPSATEAPELPTPTKKDIDDMTPMEALDEELRLKSEYQKLDNAKAERIINETREAEGYYQMSPEEQVANGKLDGWIDETNSQTNLEAAARDLSRMSPGQIQGRAESLQQWVNAGRPPEQAVLGDRQAALNVIQGKGQVVNLDNVAGIDMAQALNDRAMGRTTPATEAVRDAYMQFYGLKDKTPAVKPVPPKPPAPAARPEFVIPEDLSKSAPRFGMAKLQFESDLDRAAYMIRSKAKKSKGEDRMIAALKEQGYDVDEIRQLGNEVKAQIQDSVEEITGSRRAPQEQFTIQVPKSSLAATSEPRLGSARGDELSSIDLPGLPERPALPMQERLAKAVNLRVEQMEADLVKVAKQVFGDDLPDLKFRADEKRTTTSKDWGGDGTKTSPQNASYAFGGTQDLITINNLQNRTIAELRSSMFHEAWHRIQRGYLRPKELKVLDNVFAQRDLANYANLPGGQNIKQIEVQAVAFQNYSMMRESGETRMDVIRDAMANEIEAAFPGLKGWKKKFTVEALTVIAEGWERIMGFSSRAKNFIDGNGYQNVYDLFEQAYDGRLTKNRRFEDAMRTVDEALGMTEAQINYLEATGKIQEVNASFDNALERGTYFNKWRGKANTVLNSIDNEIAALKQLAAEGGC